MQLNVEIFRKNSVIYVRKYNNYKIGRFHAENLGFREFSIILG